MINADIIFLNILQHTYSLTDDVSRWIKQNILSSFIIQISTKWEGKSCFVSIGYCCLLWCSIVLISNGSQFVHNFICWDGKLSRSMFIWYFIVQFQIATFFFCLFLCYFGLTFFLIAFRSFILCCIFIFIFIFVFWYKINTKYTLRNIKMLQWIKAIIWNFMFWYNI